MKILYVSQHFPPETGAAQGRAYDMCKNLVKLGHDVTVVTGLPNYPTGKIPKKYKGKLQYREKIDGINVIRTFLVPDTKSGALKRLMNYFSFMFSSMISGALFVRKPDVVIATSPQLFVGFSGYVLSKIHRSKFVFEVRDLWVDFAEGLGEFKNKKLLRMAKELERFLYYKADSIVTVTKGYKQHLIDHEGIFENKIEVVTNGVEVDKFNPIKSETEKDVLKKEHNFNDKFVVLYAGNLGAAQGLDVVIDSAHILRNKKDIVFLMIGEGVEKVRLKEKKEELDLKNVIFEDGKTKDEIQEYYNMADASLVSLKSFSLFDITLPSKIFDSMAMAKPVLIGVNGEGRKIIEKANAGIYFESENGKELANGVINLYENPNMKKQMGVNARNYAIKKFARDVLASRLDKSLRKVAKNGLRTLFRFGRQNKSLQHNGFNLQPVGMMDKKNFTPTLSVGETIAQDTLKTPTIDDFVHQLLEWTSDSKLILIMTHRRENLHESMKEMSRAIRRLTDEQIDMKVIFSTHMNSTGYAVANDIFGGCERVRVVEPLESLDLQTLINNSYLILTDSSSVIEEKINFNKPTLVLSETMEDLESIEAGNSKLIRFSEGHIYDSVNLLFTNDAEYIRMSQASNSIDDVTINKAAATLEQKQ
ncbi:UDP-N-acetylglucosamine 2-epimerase [Aquibacillus sediminis]|uniref:UDP-N-acetylglucosamine 2-epimerase n=1 Tax=Aquibacillus sediminis TaxID=2574734 RepID=UPI001109A875|nr:UDP-N-acetylglucosamine 2-epimerase [Aquibacillus sediminis]